MNNFEKIKAMDIDEMAEFLFLLQNGKICGCSDCNNLCCDDLMYANKPFDYLCKEHIKQWLESEVRE